MPTFSRTPFDATKPETAPAVPTTADQRGQHANGNTAFSAAHDDVAALEAHPPRTDNPHGVTHAQTGPAADEHVAHSTINITAGAGLTGGGTIELSRTLNVGAGEGITVNANDIAAAWGGSGGDFGAATTVARSDHTHAALYEPVGALRNVIEDASPQLGGNLETNGSDVLLTTSGGAIQAVLGAFDSGAGAALAYSDDGAYVNEDGAVTVEPGVVSLYGAAVTAPGLKHAVAGGRQVYVSEEGIFYGVDPPPPGWFDSDTDVGFYARSGVGLNVWQQITGLQTTFGGDLTPGDPLDVTAAVFTRETTGNRDGTVEVGFGINGAQPISAGESFIVTSSFANFLTVSFRTTTVTATTGDTVEIWVRVTQQSNAQFSTGLQFDGSAGNDHEMSIGIPGGGAGSSTFTGLTDTPADYVGSSGKLVAVNSGATALEYVDPPTGSGDVTSTNNTTDGELQVGDSPAKGIKGAGFQGSDVARLSVANTFITGQIVNDPAGQAGFYFADNGTRVFGLFSITGPNFVIAPVNAGGSATAFGVTVANDGTVSIGTATGGGFQPGEGELNVESSVTARGVFLENAGSPSEYLNPVKDATIANNVSHTALKRDEAGAAVTPAGTGGQWVKLTNAGPITLNLPTGDTQQTFIVPDGVTVNIDAGYVTVGGPNGSGASLLQVWSTGTAGEHFAVWSHAA